MDFREEVKVFARKIPDPLRRFVKRAFIPQAAIRWMYDGSSGPALRHEAKLWGGFSRYALKDLEELKSAWAVNPKEACYAAWALARWFASIHDFSSAIENVAAMRRADPAKQWDMRAVLVEADALTHLGEREAARQCLSNMLRRRPGEVNLYLAMANTYAPLEGPGDAETDEIRLSWINRIYAQADLLPIAKADSARPLGLDNLVAMVEQQRAAKDDDAKVTVIMPVYEAAATLPFALRSVLAQTWRNLEVVVVDDCSADETFAIAQNFANRDPRVRAIRHSENQGTYVARNSGLKHATGDFITVQDADDWSHPQKIEKQVDYLLTRRRVGSMTAWLRVRPNLFINQNWKPDDRLMRWNHSSVMVRRVVLSELGGWDPVRANADSELISRIERRFGSRRLPRVGISIPWAFALQSDGSLTRQSVTHITTTQFGVRQEHRRAFTRWHDAAAKRKDFYLDPTPSAQRKFPAPAPILPVKKPPQTYDVVFVGDLALAPGALAFLHDEMRAALDNGLRVAAFHWPRYELNPIRSIDEKTAELVDQFKIDMIVAGQSVTAKRTIFFDPASLRHRLDNPPSIKSENMFVIDNLATEYCGERAAIAKDAACETLSNCFGSRGKWVTVAQLRRAVGDNQNAPDTKTSVRDIAGVAPL